MALIIDASSPAANAAVGTATNTTAAFIPPDTPLLLAMWAGESTTGVNPSAPAPASSPTQTWVTDRWRSLADFPGSVDGQAAIFHSLVTGSPGSTTVTVTSGVVISADAGSILKVYVITGHDLTTPIGATGKGGVASGGTSLSDSYTGTITGGQGFMVVCDWQGASTTGWTADTGCTIENKGSTSGISYAVVRRTTPDGVVGVSTSLGLVGLTSGGTYSWAYAEVISYEAVLAAAGHPGHPAQGHSPQMF